MVLWPYPRHALAREHVERGWRDPGLVSTFIELTRAQAEDSDLTAMQISLENMVRQLKQ